jgi:signal transduction histidine kinase
MDGRTPLPLDLALPPGVKPRRWMPTLAAGLSIGEYARSLVRRLAFLAAVLVVAIWAIGARGYFWPAWAWLGLGDLVLLDFAADWAWRRPPGAIRRVACVWTAVGVAGVILVFTWLLTWLLAGVHTFWPAWALLGLAAQAAELRRIERDLHDGAQARLVALMLQLGRAELRVSDQPEVSELIKDAQREAHLAIAELRDLARGIVPPLLADRGLVAAVESLAARYGLGTSIRADTHRGLAPAVEYAAYFVIAEGLTNTAKHAGAEHSWIELRHERRELHVTVGDDGRGGADVDAEGTGLAGLRARVEALDGGMRVRSPADGGTLLEVRLPCG